MAVRNPAITAGAACKPCTCMATNMHATSIAMLPTQQKLCSSWTLSQEAISLHDRKLQHEENGYAQHEFKCKVGLGLVPFAPRGNACMLLPLQMIILTDANLQGEWQAAAGGKCASIAQNHQAVKMSASTQT